MTEKYLCPWHVERTPSCHVNRAKQFFHCFGCGEGGDIVTFVMKMRADGRGDEVEALAAYLKEKEQEAVH